MGQPFDSLAVVPDSEILLAATGDENAEALLFSFLPHPVVFSTIWLRENTVALLLVCCEFAFVDSSIGVAEFPDAVHFVFVPVALVYSTVSPPVFSLAVKVILEKEAVVLGVLRGPGEFAETVFAAILIASFVDCPVGPLFSALSVLLVFGPVALIFGSINVQIFSMAVKHVVFPEPAIDVAISADKPTLPIGLIVLPLAFVNAAVAPDLVSVTMPLIGPGIPLSLILRLISHQHAGPPLFQNSHCFLVLIILIFKVLDFRSHSFLHRLFSGLKNH